MPLSDKTNHLSSNDHKNKTKQQQIWCEDCGKNIGDKTRHFQRETHKAHAASRTASHTTPRAALHFGQVVDVIVNEKSYNKLKVNPTENIEHHINDLPIEHYFSRYKYQLNYLAKFSKRKSSQNNPFQIKRRFWK